MNTDSIDRLQSAFTQNRAEEIGYDVWEHFVIPLFFSRLDLESAKKPRIFIGGRGCGKTMLLRYLSHQSAFSPKRKSVGDDDVQRIGLYWKADTQFANTMNGRGLSEEEWSSAFDHFVAITLGLEILVSLQSVANSNYHQVTGKTISDLNFQSIHGYLPEAPSSFAELYSLLRRKSQEFQVWANSPKRLQAPSFLPGKTFALELIQSIRTQVPCLATTTFFVFIDEYENLREYQQRVINTHIKHSESPLIFNIAIKRNGIKTNATVGEESITDIADYRMHDIDSYLEESSFEVFAAEVLLLRMSMTGQQYSFDVDRIKNPTRINERFDSAYQDVVLRQVRSMFPGLSHQEIALAVLKDNPLRKRLEREIGEGLKQKRSTLKPSAFISLAHPEASIVCAALLARPKLSADEVHEEFQNLKRGMPSRFDDPTDWTHNNFVGSLLKLYAPYGRPCPLYAGFETFIQLAHSNMRHLLELCHKSLKLMPQTTPGDSIVVSVDVQAEAARQASAGFLGEIRTFGRLGNRLYGFVLTLGSLFAFAHRRPTQSEPEINHFAIREGIETTDTELADFFREATKWSVLFEETETKLKDPGRPAAIDWILNPIYAPYFNISHRKKRKLSLPLTDLKVLISGGADARTALLKRYAKQWDVDADAVEQPLLFVLEDNRA